MNHSYKFQSTSNSTKQLICFNLINNKHDFEENEKMPNNFMIVKNYNLKKKKKKSSTNFYQYEIPRN